MIRQTDRERLLTYLYRVLDLLPWVPESMRRTLHTSCQKTIRNLAERGWITSDEAAHLSARVRDTIRNRQPSRCGFDTNEQN